MCPFTSLPEGEGPNRFSPSSVKDWQPRRKSVSNACERCRRRKIRCDGSTPCQTCSRFSLPCVRTQKTKEVLASEHQVMLETRIHQLESQLAAHVNAPMHGMEGMEGIESIDSSLLPVPSTFDWQSPPPQLSLDTAFPTPFTSGGHDMDLSNFSAGSIASLPSIAITECEHNPNISSPISPVPSFWSDTTRASSPESQSKSTPQYPPSLPMSARSQTFSPPAGLHGIDSWEFLGQQDSGQLKPQAPHSQTLSRRTSVSSASLDSDEVSEDLQPLAPIPRLPRQGIFSSRVESPIPGRPGSTFTDRSRAVDAIPLPSRFEAETLTTEFVQFIESIDGPKPYSLSPAIFRKFCDAVYPEPGSRSSSVDNSLSQKVVRFHVFMAMAIGMKVRIRDSPETTNSLLDRCYELAMQQTSSAVFWQEQGAIEAAQLLSIFASIKKDAPLEPRPLQHAFSW